MNRIAVILILLASVAQGDDVLVRDRFIRPTRSNTTSNGRIDLPWSEIHGGRFYRYGVELTNSAAGSGLTTGWEIVAAVNQSVYYPDVDGYYTNGTILTYTPTNAGMYRLEYSNLFWNTNSGAFAFDGRYVIGMNYTDRGNQANRIMLFDAPAGGTQPDVGVQNYAQNGNTTWTIGGVLYLQLAANQTFKLTNDVTISWASGDYGGWDYFNATLSRPVTP